MTIEDRIFEDRYEIHRTLILNLSQPHLICERELAEQIFERFRAEVPEAIMFHGAFGWYICRDKSVIPELKIILQAERRELIEKLSELNELIDSI